MPLDLQPKESSIFLVRESGIERSVLMTQSLPLAQGLPKGPAITVYCGQLSSSSVCVCVCVCEVLENLELETTWSRRMQQNQAVSYGVALLTSVDVFTALNEVIACMSGMFLPAESATLGTVMDHRYSSITRAVVF